MNHHQRKVLHAIFAHPLNANLEMKDVVNVLSGLGAEIDAKSKSRLGVMLNGRTMVLHLTSHKPAQGGGDADPQIPRILRNYSRRLSCLASTRRSKTRSFILRWSSCRRRPSPVSKATRLYPSIGRRRSLGTRSRHSRRPCEGRPLSP